MSKVLWSVLLLGLLVIGCVSTTDKYGNRRDAMDTDTLFNSFHVADFGRSLCQSQGLEYKTWRYYTDANGKEDVYVPTIICEENHSDTIFDGVVVKMPRKEG